MPQIITADLTASANYTVSTIAADDFIFVAEGVLVSNSSPSSPAYSAIGVFHDSNRIGVAGTLMTGASPTIYSVAANTTVSVTQTGAILSLASANFWPTVQFAGGGARVFNDGQITNFSSSAIFSSQGDAAVYNTGLISGGTFGVQGATRVENSGTIRGQTAVEMGGGNDLVLNTGTLTGHVRLGLGDDTFDTIGGTISGSVFDDGGNDLYRTDSALLTIVELAAGGTDRVEATVSFTLGTVAEVENLTLLGTAADGTGNALGNTITGNIAANRLFGEAGIDQLYGADGADLLDGGLDDDFLFGGIGDDRLVGRTGADALNGDDGEDVLVGGGGNDTMGGGEGDDTLTGGAGRDSLTGGSEADQFLFRVLTDSGTTTQTRDVIVDFQAGLDVLSLSAIDADVAVAGNQAFTFLGTGAFTGAAGQLRYYLSGTGLIVEGTVNADLVADFSIRLNGETALALGDLVL